MKDLIKHKVFIGMFLLSYFLFFFMTIYVLDIKRNGLGGGHIEYGFPFSYYYSHCFGGHYIYQGFLGNLFIASLLATFIGLISSFLINRILPQIIAKVSSPEFRSKWYL